MLKIDTARVLATEMDRKTFLKNVGIAVMGLVGVTAIVRSINGFAPVKQGSSAATGFGYGGSAYGGRDAVR